MLEMVIAIGILVIMSGLGAGYYAGTFRSISLDSTKKTIIEDLRTAQGNAMQGEFAMKWGVRFSNGASQSYELFRTPVDYADPGRITLQTSYLQSGLIFTDPATSNTKDIIFNRTTGQTSASSVTFESSTSGSSATVNVTSEGIID